MARAIVFTQMWKRSWEQLTPSSSVLNRLRHGWSRAMQRRNVNLLRVIFRLRTISLSIIWWGHIRKWSMIYLFAPSWTQISIDLSAVSKFEQMPRFRKISESKSCTAAAMDLWKIFKRVPFNFLARIFCTYYKDILRTSGALGKEILSSRQILYLSIYTEWT